MDDNNTLVDVFAAREYLHGNIYLHGGKNIISITDPNKLLFVSENQKMKSGGCSIKFITNSPKIIISYSVTDRIFGNFPHIGISAQRGLSASYRLLGKDWRNIDCFNNREDEGEVTINSRPFIPNNANYEVAVYLPINCYISSFSIGINEGSTITPVNSIPLEEKHKVLILGGKVAYGIGVTSTQFMFGHILERHISNTEVTNISFNSDSLLQIYNKTLPLIENIEKYNAICLEIPYDDLISKKDMLYDTLSSFCKKFTGKIILWYKPCLQDDYLKWSNLLTDFIAKNPQFIFNDSFTIKNDMDYDMLMHSSRFVNDSGNIFIMKQFKETLKKLWNI